MRYVIVDQDGRSGEYFDSFDDVIWAMQALRKEDPELAADVMILTYEDGRRTGEPIDASHIPYLVHLDGDVNRSSAEAGISREAAYA
jgi:hypothetical protein